MDRFYLLIASGGGAGYLPKAPGTWGSLVALPIHLLLAGLPLPQHAAAIAALCVLAVICAGQAEKILDRKDPGVVVIDEIVGMLITLFAAPTALLALPLGFFLFRLFDIAKPWPIGWIDRRINGGIGIVFDDVLAGIYSLIVLQGLWFLARLNG